GRLKTGRLRQSTSVARDSCAIFLSLIFLSKIFAALRLGVMPLISFFLVVIPSLTFLLRVNVKSLESLRILEESLARSVESMSILAESLARSRSGSLPLRQSGLAKFCRIKARRVSSAKIQAALWFSVRM